jgi:hypothetical protein
MSADALDRVIHCPHCGQEIRLDEAIVNQLTGPLRIHWEEEMRQVEERAETKITKLETQLGRVSRDLVKTQRQTRTGSPSESPRPGQPGRGRPQMKRRRAGPAPSDMQVAHQMGHSKIETTKNIYGHLFAQDRALILEAMNQAVSRLYAYENQEPGEGDGADAAA